MPKRTARVPSEVRKRAKKLREALKKRPPIEQLLTKEELENSSPYYFVLRAFVSELKTSRQRRGLTLAEVAQKTGLALETLSRLETGALTNPTWQTLARYAVAVNCKVRMQTEPMGDPAA